MELYIPQELPQMRKNKNGKLVFNKRHVPYNKGKTYDELYTPERAQEVKNSIIKANKERFHSTPPHHCKACIYEKDGDTYLFNSLADASKITGMSVKKISQYVLHYRNPKNGDKWYSISEYSELINK